MFNEIQYPSKFDLIVFPLTKSDKIFTSYLFLLYCKEDVVTSRSLINEFILHLETLLPVNAYFEIKETISNMSQIKIIFTFPRSIYKFRNKGTIYNNKNLKEFKELVISNWHSFLLKSTFADMPKELCYDKEINFIPNLYPIKGDLIALKKTKQKLITFFLQFKHTYPIHHYTDKLTTSYFEAYMKFKNFNSFVFMVKFPKLNSSDNYAIRELEYRLSCKIPLVPVAIRSLSKMPGKYELYLHIPTKTVPKDIDKPFTFKTIQYNSLFDLVKEEWERVIYNNTIAKEVTEGLIGEHPLALDFIDFTKIQLTDFAMEIQDIKQLITTKFIHEN